VKKNFPLLVVLLLVLTIYPARADAIESFRGLRWGQSLDSMSYMKFVKELDGLRYYVKMNDRMYMGDAALDWIRYAFESNRLVGVILSSRGSENARLILGLLREAYGTPSKRNNGGYYWPIGKISLSYNFNLHNERMFVSYLSEPAISHLILSEFW
jgi:hypothetical protein